MACARDQESKKGRQPPSPQPVVINLTVWRTVVGKPEWLFTYTGDADASVIETVLHHVQRLTAAVPGKWCVEVIASGFAARLLQQVKDGLRDLGRCGLQARLAIRPRTLREADVSLASAAGTGFYTERPSTRTRAQPHTN